jgi:hypothetical protein
VLELRVELIDRLTPGDALAHRRVDLGRAQSGLERVAGRPRALIRHDDKLSVEADCEGELGCMGTRLTIRTPRT